MKIGIDIDNVIANTYQDLSAHFDKFMGKKTTGQEVINIMRHHKIKMMGYWWVTWRQDLMSKITLIEGAAETIRAWHTKYEIRLITGRLPIFRRQTIHWLKKQDIPYHELHHAKERNKHKKADGLEIFIEDNFDECEIMADHCERVFMFDHPWNRRPTNKKNIIRVSSWEEIKSFL